MMNLPIPRASLVELAKWRNVSLARYEQAHELMQQVDTILDEADEARRRAAPHPGRRLVCDARRSSTFGQYRVAERGDFLESARQIIDADVWSYVVERTELERLMDKRAKDEFRQQLSDNPIEFTVENAVATLEGFLAQSSEIFARGIAEAFSALDRRFKTHDGFKIGSRVIIDRAFDDCGHWVYRSWGANHRDTLQDIERIFFVLEGKTPPLQYAGIVGAIDEARKDRPRLTASRYEVETDYFLARVFLNGNLHLWFKRRDLVARVNKTLADYYGEVIPDGQTPEDDGGLNTPKRGLARNLGWFPTPTDLAGRVIDQASILRGGLVLEPSAGSGNLACLAARAGADVECVEIDAGRAAVLDASGLYRRVIQADFLDVAPRAVFDRVVMNPPFDRERDIDHVMHALKFLKPGGRLVAIMSAHTEFAQTRKAKAFRAHIEKLRGRMLDLPARSFSSVGTNVNTIMLVVSV